MVETLIAAAEQVESVQPDRPGIEEVVGDKGYHSNEVLVDLQALGLRSYISEPDRVILLAATAVRLMDNYRTRRFSMSKTETTGRVLTASDGLWFHPDDPTQEPFIIPGKDGQPLTLEKQRYTGSLTAQDAEAFFANVTPQEELQVQEFLSVYNCEDLDGEDLDHWEETYGSRAASAKAIVRGLAIMHVRTKLLKSLFGAILLQLSCSSASLKTEYPLDAELASELCAEMDLRSDNPLCLLPALVYYQGALNDEQWELIAHLLRKVTVTTSTAAK